MIIPQIYSTGYSGARSWLVLPRIVISKVLVEMTKQQPCLSHHPFSLTIIQGEHKLTKHEHMR